MKPRPRDPATPETLRLEPRPIRSAYIVLAGEAGPVTARAEIFRTPCPELVRTGPDARAFHIEGDLYLRLSALPGAPTTATGLIAGA